MGVSVTVVLDRLRSPLSRPETRRLVGVVGVLVGAEALILLQRITTGLLLHAGMLLVLFWMIASARGHHRVYEALVFVPLLRLLNLGTGIISFNPFAWLTGVYGLLFASAYLVMRGHGFGFGDVGIRALASKRQWMVLVGSVVLGIGFGWIQWRFGLEQLPVAATPRNAALMALVLGLIVGFVEELLFRGLLQQWAAEVLSTRSAIVVVSVLFAFMHSVWFNPLDVVFAFGVSMILGSLYARTRNFYSIWAVHSTINVMAFAVLPLLAAS